MDLNVYKIVASKYINFKAMLPTRRIFIFHDVRIKSQEQQKDRGISGEGQRKETEGQRNVNVE